MTDPITAPPIARSGHLPMEAVHVDDREWETLRWEGQWSKMLFHPRPERPTEPNAGLVRYEPGAHHPRHQHDFAQVWYIVEGEFQHRRARCTGRARCSSIPIRISRSRWSPRPAGVMLFVQYPGPSTGGRPIYDGRFNVQARRPDQERLDV